MKQTRSNPSLAVALLAVCCLFHVSSANAKSTLNLDNATGRELMQAGYDQHLRYPFIYEELSMVTHDRKGNKETKSLRFFSRAESINHIKLLLLFDLPQELAGVAFLAQRKSGGALVSELHLPAFEQTMIRNSGDDADINFLDTDFTLENLIGEDLDKYYYKRQRDAIVEGSYYYVIDVFNAAILDDEKQKLLRRHYLLQDNLFITRTDYFDSMGRLRKRQSAHDLVQVTRDVWNANMRLMEDFLRESKTLFKVNRRVYSADYVPEKVFTAQWLYKNGKRDLAYEVELAVDQEAEQEPEAQAEHQLKRVKAHKEQHEVEPS
jgi:hypothetical protein